MSVGEWVGLFFTVVTGLIGVWQALKAKRYKEAGGGLVDVIEAIDDKALKGRIRDKANAMGLYDPIHALVKERTGPSKTPTAPPVAGLILFALFVPSLLGGCSALDGGPYRDAYIRYSDTGVLIRPYLKEAPDASVQALYDSFDRQTAEGQKAKGK